MTSSRFPTRKLLLFAALGVLDFALTWHLLRAGGGAVREGNFVAAWWLSHFGWLGLAAFKAATMSLAAGLGVAYLMHQLRPVFTSARQLTDATQLPVLGSVSMTWVERHRAIGRRALWTYSFGAALLILLALVTLLTDDYTSRFLHALIA